jgi:predicted DNA-binding antitoxin AbrB/MazE fold protein
MYERVRATYHNGTFIPVVPVSLPEATEVELTIEPASETATALSAVQPPLVADPAERARLLRELVESMQAHPISMDAPRFTREELYDRG